MPDPWGNLARQFGRKSVMSLAISDATLDAETERQAALIFPLVQRHLRGTERTALDYGCGAGRFTPYLGDLVTGQVVGFDPCAELLAERPVLPGYRYQFVTGDPERFFDRSNVLGGYHSHFDIIFLAMVLCLPHVDVHATVSGLAGLLSPDGQIVLLDHMPDVDPGGTWAHMRSFSFYRDVFAEHGIALAHVGTVKQLDKDVAICIGGRGE